MSKTTVVEEADEGAVERAALSKAGAQLLLLVTLREGLGEDAARAVTQEFRRLIEERQGDGTA